MNSAGLYPEPPHLIVAVYAPRDEGETFAALCDLVQTAGCRPTGQLEVAPRGVAFEYRSDLADVAQQVTFTGSRLTTVVGGQDTDLQALRAGFRHESHGIAVVELLPAPAGDRHPVGVAVGAGALGIPESSQDKGAQAAARKLARWTTSLLHQACALPDVLYGGIGVELRMPTPAWLRSGQVPVPSELFVSQRLLTADPTLAGTLRTEFGDDGTAWPQGSFFAGWAPFHPRHVTLPDIPHRFRATTAALATATRNSG